MQNSQKFPNENFEKKFKKNFENFEKINFEKIDCGSLDAYIKIIPYEPELNILREYQTSEQYLEIDEEDFDIVEAFERDKKIIEEKETKKSKKKTLLGVGNGEEQGLEKSINSGVGKKSVLSAEKIGLQNQ